MSSYRMHTPALPEDYTSFTCMFGELGLHTPALPFNEWIIKLAPSTIFLCDNGGSKVAYAYTEVLKTTGYIRHFVVAPGHRQQGVGRELLRYLAQWLREKKCAKWRLNVFRSNLPAIALYRSVGLEVVYECAKLRLAWAAIDALFSDTCGKQPFRASSEVQDTSISAPGTKVDELLPCDKVCVVQPDEDRLIEDSYALPEGQLARLRALSGNILVMLRRCGGHSSNDSESERVGARHSSGKGSGASLQVPPGCSCEGPKCVGPQLLGFACFQSGAYNGCNPFKMGSLAAARRILEYLRPQAQGNESQFAVMLEGPAMEFVKQLKRIGGAVELELYHMEGLIPLL